MTSRLALPLAALLLGFQPTRAAAQVTAFRFDSTRVPVGRLLEYVKSNRDGSNAGRVSLYVATRDRIESLKWSPGDTSATLVVARLDWTRFSADRLEGWRLLRGRPPELRATLESTADSAVRISLDPGRPVAIRAWPWHSYDFDFASLGMTLPHLHSPEAGLTFERADITYAEDGPPFADLGPVRLRFLERERRGTWDTRRYAIGGPGLHHQEGLLWAAVDGGYIVEYELPIPDEPGYTDGRLRLETTDSLTVPEWEALKLRRVSGAR